jgi:predicted Zn finger-like uncharacterized protein
MAEILKCPGCQAVLRVRADMAGKEIKCPRCGRAMPVPAAEARVGEKARPAPAEVVTVEPIDEEEEVPAKPASRFKPCPRCGAAESKRIPFTFWGSFYFTALFSHVGCPACGCRYNGRTGRSNLLPATACVSVALACLGGLFWVIVYLFQKQGYSWDAALKYLGIK